MLTGVIVGIVVFAILLWAQREDTLPETAITLMLLGGVVSCHQSDWYQASLKADEVAAAVQAKTDATPHVIREVDGCKVYTFKAAEKWHYFTRCPANTTTESHHDEDQGSGKQHKTVDVAETIVTVNAK